jgi:hypothetical protein
VRLDVFVVLGQQTRVKWARVVGVCVTLNLFLFLWGPIFFHDVLLSQYGKSRSTSQRRSG